MDTTTTTSTIDQLVDLMIAGALSKDRLIEMQVEELKKLPAPSNMEEAQQQMARVDRIILQRLKEESNAMRAPADA